ncbi:MAG: AAA family ATPase [Clostridiales bacterium]|jgi:stage V sporulation protein K|nr:AAA family ATPase [Clostridiales bacterium]
MKRTARFSYVYKRENNELKHYRKESMPLAEKTEQKRVRPEVTVNHENLQALFGELDQLIGLSKVKNLVREMKAYVEICRRRQQFQLKNDSMVLHMVFKGNPGTGKTTVARIFGRMFTALQVLPKGHLVEVERADLVGEYIGHTAKKTRDQVNKAMGGILFIDEAYSLARGGEKDFGKEAIDTLVKAMEDHKNEFVLILAGYEKEMEKFLRSNPGLRSRFPIHLDFPDYTNEELIEIAGVMLRERQYCLSVGAEDCLSQYLKSQISSGNANFSNARLVRNLLERAIRRQALRLVGRQVYSREELMKITREDLAPWGDDSNSWESPV